MVRKLSNFDDWIDYFRYWQDSIGLPQGELRNFQFDAKFGDPEVPHIEFGHYRGQRKWPSVMHIPDQRIRDALLNLIVYQGDTEFASVEQQRNLLGHAPTDYDLLALMRVMTEEMRHGWQMSYLLCAHFGDEGKREAAKLLERRADDGERLLGSFNEIVATWLDFFTYTQFIDRDGKFQLKMLSVSAFDPLSRSMGPMLKEESFHLGTGNNGLLRIVKAGKMPAETIQRFFYKWVPTAFDLFGNDNSSSAHWAYVWGLKGRYDERENAQEPDKAKLNEYARELYRQEIVKLVERLNMFIPERERWLKVPELKFNRKIGVYAHQMYTVDGEPIDSKERYAAYLKTVLPQARDYEVENSLAAFRAAARLGADGVELDVHATADGTPVVHHDETIGGTHHIPHLSARQLQGFRLANGEPIPTLAQALDAAGRTLQVFVEVKSLAPQFDGRLLEVLDRGPNPAGYAVHSFDHRIVRRLGQARPSLPRGVLSSAYPVRPLAALEDAGATTLWQERTMVDRALVEAMHAAGHRIVAWTVDEPEDMRRLIGLAVDGICTNFPDLGRRAIEAAA